MRSVMMKLSLLNAVCGSKIELHSKITEKELAENERKKQKRKEMFARQTIPGLQNLRVTKMGADGLTKAERIRLQLQGIKTGKD